MRTLLISICLLLGLASVLHHCPGPERRSADCPKDSLLVILPPPQDTFYMQGPVKTIVRYLPDSTRMSPKTLYQREFSDSNLTVWLTDTFQLNRPASGRLSYQLKRPVPAFVQISPVRQKPRWAFLAGGGFSAGLPPAGGGGVSVYGILALRQPSGHLWQVHYDPFRNQLSVGRMWQIRFKKKGGNR